MQLKNYSLLKKCASGGAFSALATLVIELNGKKAFAHTPPNRALLPTGRHINLDELLLHMNGSLNSIREENDNLFI